VEVSTAHPQKSLSGEKSPFHLLTLYLV